MPFGGTLLWATLGINLFVYNGLKNLNNKKYKMQRARVNIIPYMHTPVQKSSTKLKQGISGEIEL